MVGAGSNRLDRSLTMDNHDICPGIFCLLLQDPRSVMAGTWVISTPQRSLTPKSCADSCTRLSVDITDVVLEVST